jgi:hypothetical protein
VTSQASAEQEGALLVAHTLPSCGATRLHPPPPAFTHCSSTLTPALLMGRAPVGSFGVRVMVLVCRAFHVAATTCVNLPSISPHFHALHAATPCSWPPHLCGHPHLGASQGVPPPLRRAPGGSFQVWPWCWLWLRIWGSIPTSLYWCEPPLSSSAHVPPRVLVGGPTLPGPVLHPPGAPTSLRLLTVVPTRRGCACG